MTAVRRTTPAGETYVLAPVADAGWRGRRYDKRTTGRCSGCAFGFANSDACQEFYAVRRGQMCSHSSIPDTAAVWVLDTPEGWKHYKAAQVIARMEGS